jgi:E3 ubiquitin-protein ligase synoviolin
MRYAYYAAASTAAAAACLINAFHQRPNFYSATVYLSQSNACLLIITNLLLVQACAFLYALQRLLYGPLRPIEIEQLSEKAWYAVLDTLLAMPSFREDVGGWLLTMFVLLLASKVWGWIGEGRVDVLEQQQPPSDPRWFHARLATSLAVSVGFSAWMLWYCVESVVEDPRPGMMVIFTFEFAVQVVFTVFTAARYGLAVVEMEIVRRQMTSAIELRKQEIWEERRAEARREGRQEEGEESLAGIEVDENEVDVPGWEDKRRYLFGLEVVTDFIKLVIYIVFFAVSVTFNGLPMHIMRDVYMTFASFTKRIGDYVAYRKATSDMNSRYPDATTEEIRGDACIVCRENMVAWADGEPQPEAPADGQPAAAPTPARRRDEGLRAKKLPCGHILHLRCLKAWLERQQVCPTCRRPVITAQTASNGAGNAAAGGRPGQQPPAPRARGRIFNLGPLRIGLVNAPAGQMRNIINQLHNPGAAAGLDAAPAAAGATPARNQEGEQHARDGNSGEARSRGSRRSRAPVNVQLLQLEQRLLQEAHNLGIEAQQLAHLRAMEAELARLRALQIPTTTQMLQAQAAQQQRHPEMRFPMPGFAPQHFQPQQQQPLEQHLTGATSQVLGAGHEGLPDGLVLPEGWSILPLHRLGEAPRPLSQPGATPAAVVGNSSLGTGPTDEHGSPLFVPAPGIGSNDGNFGAAAAATSSAPVVEAVIVPLRHGSPEDQTEEREGRERAAREGPSLRSQENVSEPETQRPGGQDEQPQESSRGRDGFGVDDGIGEGVIRTASTPPTAQLWGADWGFEGGDAGAARPSEAPGSSSGRGDTQGEDGRVEGDGHADGREEGKGKARAVEVEDVPDAE